MTPEALSNIQDLEEKLGLPQEFFLKLSGEDDWSFLIKLNALFEAVSTDLRCKRLNAPELEDSFAHLDYGHPKYGKAKLLRRLGCITKNEESFLKLLYELRNRVAHKVSDTSFCLSEHFDSLDANQKRNFLNAIIADGDAQIYWNGEFRPKVEAIVAYPKSMMSYTAGDILASMCNQIGRASNT
tara:strand:+ start:776 stop:1327 length:552 start_codon:yes stop_codon:yes gene_type:complete